MDANQLLFYMRGFFELVEGDPTPAQMQALRAEVLRATPSKLVPPGFENRELECVGCRQTDEVRFVPPPPYVDHTKI